MNCKQTSKLMGAYIYGDLPPEQMQEVRTHANECTRCREDLSSRKAAVAAIPGQVPELTDAEKQRIEWFVKGALSRQSEHPRVSRWMVPALGGAAAVAAGLAIAVLLASGGTKPIPVRPEKSSASKAVAKVRREPSEHPTAESAETARVKKPQSGPPDALSIAETVTRAVGAAVRTGAGVASASRGSSHNKPILPGKPAEEVPTVEEDIKDEPQEKPLTLPEPAGPLDARTAPAEPD